MFALASVTFREILRDRLYLVSGFLALGLIGVSVLASYLTYNTPERILLNFGLSGMSLALSVLAILIGATMMSREEERRTLWVVLAKPISRSGFAVGKWLGLLGAIVLNGVLLSAVTAGILIVMGGRIHQPQVLAFALLILQAVLMSSLALLGSIVFSRTFSMVLCVGLYLVGQNQSQIAKMADGNPLLKVVTWVFPNFEIYHLGWLATYSLPVSAEFLWYALGYTFVATGVVLFLACRGLERRGV